MGKKHGEKSGKTLETSWRKPLEQLWKKNRAVIRSHANDIQHYCRNQREPRTEPFFSFYTRGNSLLLYLAPHFQFSSQRYGLECASTRQKKCEIPNKGMYYINPTHGYAMEHKEGEWEHSAIQSGMTTSTTSKSQRESMGIQSKRWIYGPKKII